MRGRYAQLGGRVELSTVAQTLDQDADGVTVGTSTLAGPAAVRARYVVGADGGQSTTRKLPGLSMTGETRECQRPYLGDVQLEGLDRERMYVWTSPEGLLLLTPLPGGDLWQFQCSVRPETEVPASPSLQLYQALLRRRAGAEGVRLTRASWLSIYRVDVRMVEQFRQGRVFLAGDAAHVHSGGLGMNTGIQDAYNLGWKLAAALGGADAALLDSYDEERRPVARAVLEDSTRKLGSLIRSVTDDGNLSQAMSTLRDDFTSGLLTEYRSSSLTRRFSAADFRSAPGLQAGDRAPDAAGLVGEPGEVSLFDLFRGPHWTLPLFTDDDTQLDALRTH